MEWLAPLPDDSAIWIDEGGLLLESEAGGYLEVGGEPLEKEEP